MKKCLILILTLSLLCGTLLPTVSAAAVPTDAVSLVQALGIMTGDDKGNMNLDKNVTRAEFCKMLVAASTYKDSAGGTGFSLFKDVKSGHWAAGYIKLCVENGWFTGYMDGTFRPSNPITLEEAATVSLRLLGYTNADLPGAYPAPQLSKFESLNLGQGVTAQKGSYMTRGDCAHLFANLMSVKNKEGQYHAATLGYTVDAAGKLDYSALVSKDTEGPFTLTGTLAELLPDSFDSGASVYRNGLAASADSAERYDVCYYNAKLRTVWLYSTRVTGSYTAATPSAAAPSEVTVAGKNYKIEDSAAAYKLSTQGAYRVGDTVTLLLGMDGGVTDVLDPSDTTGIFYGVALGVQEETVTDAEGKVTVVQTNRIYCTDGVERSFDAHGSAFKPGTAIQIDYSKKQPVTHASSGLHYGKFANGSFGSLKLADGVEILDTNPYGIVKKIYPSRLEGCSLDVENVLFHAENAKGEITHLILRDATGDAEQYGLILSSTEGDASTGIASTYVCLFGGEKKTLSNPGAVYYADAGAARFLYDEDGQLKTIKNLRYLNVVSVDGLTLTAGERRYNIHEDAEIYIHRDGGYFAAPLDSVREGYKLTAYSDDLGYPAGGVVRFIVAEPK